MNGSRGLLLPYVRLLAIALTAIVLPLIAWRPGELRLFALRPAHGRVGKGAVRGAP